MQNFSTAEEALEVALNSAGSAAAEHDKWMQSIEASQEKAKASFESLSTSILSSGLVKFVYDAQSGILGFLSMIIDKLGAIPTLAAAAVAALSFKNKGIVRTTDSGNLAFGWNVKQKNALEQISKDEAALTSLWAQMDGASKESVFAATMHDASEAAKELGMSANFTKDQIGDFVTSQKAAIKSSSMFAGVGKTVVAGLKSMAMAFAQMAAVAAVMWAGQKIIEGISNYINRVQILEDKIDTLDSEYEQLQSRIGETNDELATTAARIKELEDKPNLTFVEDAELEKLREANRLLGIRYEAEIAAAEKNRREAADTAEEGFYAWEKDNSANFALTSERTRSGQLTARQHPIAIVRNLEGLEDERGKATDAEKIKDLDKTIDEVRGYLNDQRIKLLDYYTPLFELEEDKRTTDQKSAMSQILFLIDYIQKALEPEMWFEDMFDRIFSDESFAPLQDRLAEMAEQGGLSLESIAHADFSPLLAEFEKLGLGAVDVVSHFNQMQESAEEALGGPFSASVVSGRLTAELDNYAAALKLLSEQEGGSLSSAAYDELVKLNPNYASAIDTDTGAIRLNAEALRELHEAEMAAISGDIATGKQNKLQEYQDVSKAIETNISLIKDLNDVSEDELETYDLTVESRKDFIDILEKENSNLLANRNQIREDIGAFDRLANDIQYATSAYKKWQDAKNAPEAGDNYEGMQDVLKSVEEGLESGKIGTNEFRAALETLFPDDLDPHDRAAIQKYFKSASKYITDDEDGINRFIKDMEKAGFVEKMENGLFQTTGKANVEDIAKYFGFSEEFTRYMLSALKDYDWTVDIEGMYEATDAIKDLEEAKATLAEKQAKLDELKRDPSASEAEINALEEETLAQEELVAAQEKELNVQKEPVKSPLETLTQQMSEYVAYLETAEKLGIPVAFTADVAAELARIQSLIDAVEEADRLAAECKVTGDPQPLIDELEKLENPEGGNKVNYQVSIYKSALYAKTIQDILRDKGALGKGASFTVSSVGAQLVAAKLKRLLGIQDTLDKKKTGGAIRNRINVEISGAWKSDLEQLDRMMTELEARTAPGPQFGENVFATQEWSEFTKALNSGETKSALGALDTLLALYGKTTGDYGITEETLPSVLKAAEILTGLDLSKAFEPVDDLRDGEGVGDLGLGETTSAVDDLGDRLKDLDVTQIQDKTFTVTQQNKVTWFGQNLLRNPFFEGPTNAKGNPSAAGGKEVVGDSGPEAVISPSRGFWRLYKKPTAVDLKPGDMVLNPKETDDMLSGRGAKTVGGKSFAKGGIFGSIAAAINALKDKRKFPGKTNVNAGQNSASSSSSGSGKTKPGKSGSSGTDSALEALAKLFDWVEVALSKIAETTKKLISDAGKAIGHIAQNAKLDAAIASTQKELETSQRAYDTYMKQADKVAKKLKMPAGLIEKIQNGDIDIASYDENTRKKIEEYQKWYEKAQGVKDTIEELREQEEELAKTKLDNITKDYDNRIARTDSKVSKSEKRIEKKRATGQRITTSDYDVSIDATTTKIGQIRGKRDALSQEFEKLVLSGMIQKDSDAWHDYVGQIEDLDEELIQTEIDLQDFKDAVSEIAVNDLKFDLSGLEQAQAAMEALMSLREAQGRDATESDFTSLIDGGHKQIENLAAQNAELRKQQAGLDVVSEKYQEIEAQINSNESAIGQIKISQEQWLDSVKDLQIESLQKQREELEKTNAALDLQKRKQQALADLKKAEQRKTRVFREGVGWVYEADTEAIQEAQDRLDEIKHEETLNKIDEAIEAIENSKSDENVYDEFGNLIDKSNQTAVIDGGSAGAMLQGTIGVADALNVLSDDLVQQRTTTNKTFDQAAGAMVAQTASSAQALSAVTSALDQQRQASVSALTSVSKTLVKQGDVVSNSIGVVTDQMVQERGVVVNALNSVADNTNEATQALSVVSGALESTAQGLTQHTGGLIDLPVDVLVQSRSMKSDGVFDAKEIQGFLASYARGDQEFRNLINEAAERNAHARSASANDSKSISVSVDQILIQGVDDPDAIAGQVVKSIAAQLDRAMLQEIYKT